jgi:hypothetical protein
MKYRIKIVTYKNGRKGYFAQYKNILWWTGLWHDGSAHGLPLDTDDCTSRDWALARIDKHFGGNTKSQVIEFEYIDK